MEAEAVEDVEGEKGVEEEEEVEKQKEEEEEVVVDATGVTSMLLRLTVQPTRRKSSKTPQKVSWGPQKVWDTVYRHCTDARGNFIDGHSAVLSEICLGKVTERQHPASDS